MSPDDKPILPERKITDVQFLRDLAEFYSRSTDPQIKAHANRLYQISNKLSMLVHEAQKPRSPP